MAMSDCVKCWDTPCRCGHDYREWSPENRGQLILAIASSGPVKFGISDLNRFGRPDADGMRAVDRIAAALGGGS